MALDEAVGATTVDAPASTSEGSPSSDVSSSPATEPTADRTQSSATDFAEKLAATVNAGSDKPRKGGWIPQARHDDILGKTRDEWTQKETAWNSEREAFERDFGWARNVNRDQFARLEQWDQKLSSDPVAAVLDMIRGIQSHPVHAQAWRNYVAGQLQAAQPQPSEVPMPQPDIRHTENGKEYAWYSDTQLAKRDEWLTNRILQQVHGVVAPLQDGVQEFQRLQQAEHTRLQSRNLSQDVYSRIVALPGVEVDANGHLKDKDFAVAIEQELKAMNVPAEVAGQPDVIRQLTHNALQIAYAKSIVPKLQASAQAQAKSDLTQKARASTLNPKRQGGSAPTKQEDTRTFAEKLRDNVAKAQ